MRFKLWIENDDIIVPPGNLNIPRKEMPQIQASDVQDFLKFLDKKNIKHVKKDVPAKDLKATQKEIDLEKANNLRKEDSVNLKKPMLVSKDSHIMDGHHRWLALLSKNDTCPCHVIDLPMKELLKLGKEFPKSFKKDI
jgi:hypothetical protein